MLPSGDTSAYPAGGWRPADCGTRPPAAAATHVPDDARLDRDACLQRLAWSGDLRNDYATLAALVDAHMARIPFENLDVLLGRGIRIDLTSIQAKLVHARRGGYCFEHATLFAAVLDAIGFAPVRHIARVVMALPREASPRTQMFLSVPLAEETFVVDPGFGSMAPRMPVPLAEGKRARAEGIAHGLTRDGSGWLLRAAMPDKTVDCWYSARARDPPVDFEVGNHFTATYPSSPLLALVMFVVDARRPFSPPATLPPGAR